jgi:hypothetical protein
MEIGPSRKSAAASLPDDQRLTLQAPRTRGKSRAQ